jgi:amino acid exporter
LDQVSAHLPGVILAYSAFFLSIMSPGPNVLAILGTSMGVGRSSGVALALGVATGSFCWAALTFSGLTALIASYAGVLTIIKIVGGLYLLWLAYKAFCSATSEHDIAVVTVAGSNHSRSHYFFHGLAVQMTNPKAALAWIAIISLGVRADSPLWVGLSIVIGTSLLSLLIHFLYAVAFSTTTMGRLYGKARRWIQGAIGAFFAFAGIKLLVSRS